MYAVDEQDEVVCIDGLPPHDAGAPMPVVLAGDSGLVLSYERAPDGAERIVLRFAGARAHFFGPPNDEAIAGHPLARRGIKPYGIFEVRRSSWIRLMEQNNRIHPQHNPHRYERLKHFVFTFHDGTFECVAEEARVVAQMPSNADDAAIVRAVAGCLRRGA